MSDLAEAQAAGVRFRVVVRSSESSPQGALEAVSSLVERDGVSLIVGLPTSAELGGALAYLIDHDVAAISSASTAPDPRLMQPDTVYRLMPSELYLARRLAGLALDQGYTRAALIFRTDGWGDRYAAQVQAVFGDRGFPAVGVPITPTHPRVTDYASEVAALSDEVAKLGADERTVVIMAVWEGEDLNILHHAGQDQRLSRVRWLSAVLYPSLRDGTFGAPDMELPDASDFAFEHRLWGQEFLPQPSAEVQRLFLATKRELGRQPRFEHVFLYDAVQLAARAALLAGTTDGPSVAARIPEAAAAYRGVTGRIHFDAHGDRDSGNLAYYGLVPQGAGYEFRYYAYHLDGTGEFEILPQPESRTITFCPEC